MFTDLKFIEEVMLGVGYTIAGLVIVLVVSLLFLLTSFLVQYFFRLFMSNKNLNKDYRIVSYCFKNETHDKILKLAKKEISI